MMKNSVMGKNLDSQFTFASSQQLIYN